MTFDDLKKIIDINWEQNARLNAIEEEDTTKRYLYITGLTSIGVDEDGEPYTIETAIAAHEDDENYVERLAWNIPGSSGLDLDEDDANSSEVTPETKPEPEPEPEDDEEKKTLM